MGAARLVFFYDLYSFVFVTLILLFFYDLGIEVFALARALSGCLTTGIFWLYVANKCNVSSLRVFFLCLPFTLASIVSILVSDKLCFYVAKDFWVLFKLMFLCLVFFTLYGFSLMIMWKMGLNKVKEYVALKTALTIKAHQLKARFL